ncbi:MAG TPA: hypothetical protein VMF59_06910 [Bacteroidota bacterium]|nr:hypothetical protein [Bacteroidota bacterium]
MLNPREINVSALGDRGPEFLRQARIELKMNLSLLEMLKGNTQLEDLANFRKEWVEPLKGLVDDLERIRPGE